MGIKIVANLHWYFIATWPLLVYSVHAQDEATELNQIYGDILTEERTDQPSAWHGFLGAAAVATEQALGDKRGFFAPLVAVTYADIFYWQIARGGVWIFKSKDRRIRSGLVVKPRRGFKPDDYAGLAGMEVRTTSVEVGVNGVWVSRPVTVSAAYYTDVSNKSDGDSANLGLSHPIRVGNRWRITPSIGAEWLSTDLINYYYGVKFNEITAIRPAYQGQDSINLRLSMALHYGLTRDWVLFGGVNYTQLGSGITTSPLVINDHVTTLHFGSGWIF